MEIELTNKSLGWILFFTTIASTVILYSWLRKQDRITALDIVGMLLLATIPPFNMLVIFVWAVVIPIVRLVDFLNDLVLFRNKN